MFTGRVDGRVSLATEAARDLPSAGANFTTLQKLFAESDLDVVDLVALSGLPYLIYHFLVITFAYTLLIRNQVN